MLQHGTSIWFGLPSAHLLEQKREPLKIKKTAIYKIKNTAIYKM